MEPGRNGRDPAGPGRRVCGRHLGARWPDHCGQSVAAYVAFFAVGLGPVFWLLIAEIFPLAVRGRAMSLATAIRN